MVAGVEVVLFDVAPGQAPISTAVLATPAMVPCLLTEVPEGSNPCYQKLEPLECPLVLALSFPHSLLPSTIVTSPTTICRTCPLYLWEASQEGPTS
jgi:hypothetical protein